MIIKATYRRHVFEVVEELSDAIFWTVILCGLSVPAGILLNYHRLWAFALLSIYPVARFFIELLSWWNELYIIEEGDDSAVLRKHWGIINKKRISDPLKNVSLFSEQSLHMRVLGACRIKVSSAANTFIEGRLVPVAFLQKLDQIISGHKGSIESESTGNVTLDMARMLPHLVDVGLVDPMIARGFIETTIGEMWR